MLSRVLILGRWVLRYGWIGGVVLVVATMSLGTVGFLNENDLSKKAYTPGDAVYKAIGLIAIQLDVQPTPGNTAFELARWLGVAFFAGAVVTFAVRLSRDTVQRVLLGFARGHVVVAGLGDTGVQLVAALRRKNRTVVVLEPDRDHPAVEHCRRLGAFILFGETDDRRMLTACGLRRAAELLALFQDEKASVRTTTTAFEMLRPEAAAPPRPPVRCVLRLIEPGLLDVIRRHKIKTDPADRFQLEILNSHEIAAATMVREAAATSRDGRLNGVLVVGLGSHHRLGELVILRLVKDRLIQRNGAVESKLQVHVYDKDAEKWAETFHSRYPFAGQVATIHPHADVWARKAGPKDFAADADAAFVCIADEDHATVQAVMLRRSVLVADQPIMVRVRQRRSGFGELLGKAGSGWGDNLHAVGLDDALLDPDLATKPELELQAMTIHQEFRELMRCCYLLATTDRERRDIETKGTNVPWHDLREADRQQNRDQARRYDEYLALLTAAKRTRYRRAFDPAAFCRVAEPLLFEFPPHELDVLAEAEHERYVMMRTAQGWTHGDTRDDATLRSPFMCPFAALTDAMKAYNREFVAKIPLVLALGDYAIGTDGAKK